MNKSVQQSGCNPDHPPIVLRRLESRGRPPATNAATEKPSCQPRSTRCNSSTVYKLQTLRRPWCLRCLLLLQTRCSKHNRINDKYIHMTVVARINTQDCRETSTPFSLSTIRHPSGRGGHPRPPSAVLSRHGLLKIPHSSPRGRQRTAR